LLNSPKARYTGSPIRAAFFGADPERARAQFELGHHTPIIVVFGGSQGARYFSDTVPEAFAHMLQSMPDGFRDHLKIVQQCRDEDLDRVRATYASLGVDAECAPFFGDLPARIAESQLVIARSGASTVAEMTVIGRPAILVPLPHALDNDQLHNAKHVADSHAGWLARQQDLTPQVLAVQMAELLQAQTQLASAAQAAKGLGRPDAAERLADVVARIAT